MPRPTSPRLVPLIAALALTPALSDTMTSAAQATTDSPTTQRAVSTYGSLVFVKDYDVWIARADGAQARRLTTDGSYAHPYVSPSQADTGEVVVAHEKRILRMTPSGRVLNVIDPPSLESSVGADMDGTPANVAISPNGELIAYTHALYSCPPAADCDTRFATAYTAADHLTDPARHRTTYYDAPGWIGNGRTVQGGGQFTEVNLHDIDGPPRHWFRDSEIDSPAKDLSDPAVSRDQQWVATVRGYGSGTSLLWSRVNGPVSAGSTPQLPTPWCETNSEPGVAGPAFSADSDTLAWTLPSGIWMKSAPGDCSVQPGLVVPGGSQASFSAAEYSVPAPENLTHPRVRGTAKPGRTLRASTGSWTMTPTYGYQWLRNGKAVHGATRSTYRVARRDAGQRIAVRVTARGDGGLTTVTSPVVKVGS